MGQSSFDRARSLGHVIGNVRRLFARSLQRELAVHGIPVGQFPVLLVLWEEQRLTQSEIARRLDMEQPTVSNTLVRMKRDGLIEMLPDPLHGRKMLAILTPKAEALRETLHRVAAAINDQAASVFAEEELESLFSSLDRLAARLKELGPPEEA